MITNLSNTVQIQQMHGSPPSLALFIKFVELLRSFKKMETTCTTLLDQEKIGTIPATDGIVEIELIEYADETGISPPRLRSFLSNIIELHTALTILYGVPTDQLTFKYFDSGSGVLIGIQCAKVIAETINTVLTEWWTKIRFWRFDTFDKRMEAISKGLKTADEIHTAVEKGTIDAETGRNLNVRIFRHVDNLVGIGATVPLPKEATIDQRQLLTEMRNTKLLSDGTAEPRQ